MRPLNRRHPPVNPLHCIWRKVRGPFRVMRCTQHTWERYDVQNAGCLLCGAAHECKIFLNESDCSLERMEDCSLCCSITGFCVPTVRYSDCEYVEGITYEKSKTICNKNNKVVFDDVLSLVKWFISGKLAESCKIDEVNKTVVRIHAASVKILKNHKLSSPQNQTKIPCILTVLAQTLHQLKLKVYKSPPHDLCIFCATHITLCLNNLRLANVQNRKVNLILGMLYLMKQGLVIQNKQWLPKTPELAQCLPHETSLEKVFKLSMKLVCETENEIKLALRQQVKLI